MIRTARIVRTLSWTALLAAAWWALVHADIGTSPPRWSAVDEWPEWVARHDVVDVVVAAARPVAVVLVSYLLLVTLAQLVPAPRGGRWRSWVQRATPGVVVTLTAGLAVSSPVGAGAAEPPPGPAPDTGRGARMELIAPESDPDPASRTQLPWADPTTTTTSPPPSVTAPSSTTVPPTTARPTTTSPPRSSTTTSVRPNRPSTTSPAPTTTTTRSPTADARSTSPFERAIPDPTPDGPPQPTRVAGPTSEPIGSTGSVDPTSGDPTLAAPTDPTPAGSAPPPETARTSYVVQVGDHLWSIAEHVVSSAGATEPDEATVAAFWRVLIDLNRDRLVEPDDPDLILPGQELVLPQR